uniref:RING-type domain-containing protein n=1 Tax=Kalanchoe fedtschenkoi TaxID=63787 RepID=A0A7N0VAX9_KALFE
MGGGSRLKRAARRIAFFACVPFFGKSTAAGDAAAVPAGSVNVLKLEAEEPASSASCGSLATKNLCAICLDPLSCNKSNVPDQAIFTAQCCHAFHFACISSNVRHGNVTCPICRAHWTQLPRNLNPPIYTQNDPVLQILDDSIASFRGHRRSFLRSATYNDDDPIDQESHYSGTHPRLLFSLIPARQNHPTFHSRALQVPRQIPYYPYGHYLATPSSLVSPAESYSPSGRAAYLCPSSRAYLTVKLAPQQPTDLVLVASPNGPHLRLLKQSMALVVSSLRSVDRLAIVANSSAAARVFPLRRMTAYGRRTALHVIDRLFFYMGQADPAEGLKKGVKVLEDRTHKNPSFCILHLSDNPTRSYRAMEMEMHIPIHRFHVGFGYGTSNGFVMHEFEGFLTRVLGGVIRETQLRVGDEARIVRLGELRGGEERRISVNLAEYQHLYLAYSYIDNATDECIRTGETVVCVGEKNDEAEARDRDAVIGGRISSVENWDYHDPYMARRWSKYLHGYRL